MLYDFDMPLFNKEFTREEFDRKVRENPLNDHLKVNVLPVEEKAVIGEEKAENDTETAQNTSPATGYEDAFFIDRDNESVTWIYYNPDSNAGGQYVTNTLSFDEIREAAKEYKTAEDFSIISAALQIRNLPMWERNGLRTLKQNFIRHRT